MCHIIRVHTAVWTEPSSLHVYHEPERVLLRSGVQLLELQDMVQVDVEVIKKDLPQGNVSDLQQPNLNSKSNM